MSDSIGTLEEINKSIKSKFDEDTSNKTDNFQAITRSKIDPSYSLDEGEIKFCISTGDDKSSDENIKISRGEESVFVWSVFYTVLDVAISALSEKKEDRETELFNDLEYIIIDDPVSSLDDTNIITIAIKLKELINNKKNTKLKFLISTHHALFFNVLQNEFSRTKEIKLSAELLSKNLNGYELKKQGDTPFAYHNVIKNEIQNAINSNNLKRYHFNLLRGLLEKTATFLGYAHWSDCIEGDSKTEIKRLINLFNHNKLSEIESSNISEQDKDTFKETFKNFIENYKWNQNTTPN